MNTSPPLSTASGWARVGRGGKVSGPASRRELHLRVGARAHERTPSAVGEVAKKKLRGNEPPPNSGLIGPDPACHLPLPHGPRDIATRATTPNTRAGTLAQQGSQADRGRDRSEGVGRKEETARSERHEHDVLQGQGERGHGGEERDRAGGRVPPLTQVRNDRVAEEPAITERLEDEFVVSQRERLADQEERRTEEPVRVSGQYGGCLRGGVSGLGPPSATAGPCSFPTDRASRGS
jgi:hypothetical protein